VEHRLLLGVFEQIENILPEITTTGEAERFAKMVKELLNRHADVEDNLVYVTLDHALDFQGKLNHLFQEHREVDFCFDNVPSAEDLPHARTLLKRALKASREHFLREERVIFPLIEQVLTNETLIELGYLWEQKQMAS
jgi:hemerythrin-like domain-containing protein